MRALPEGSETGQATAPGTFFAIVGPSGAGKDTLLDGVRDRLTGDPRWHFAIRHITRPADAGGEAHTETRPDQFQAMATAGEFALHWQAHDLSYGINRAERDRILCGQNVIANLSRAAIPDAVEVFPRVHVIHVTAPDTIIAQRLHARGREAPDDIARRIARANQALSRLAPVTEIINDRSIDDGIAAFMTALAAGSAVSG